MAYDAGEVVLVPFPFRDQLSERTRPAVVVSASAFNILGDLVLAAVTSHAPRNTFDYGLIDWKSAGLLVPSTVRMLLATMSYNRVAHRVGTLSVRDWDEVKKKVLQLFAWP
ncbi:MAG: type II toxin-antitoxin system PemK/MazF family toxin [Gemmataceae bacterium]|nr:type II toxin-antitoxin system PemK/MazF family toxin [Gemmataceae bacterium]MCI0742772.1 type II toxin-antitoxin system PemK/MazF family toxin [Gemmataceae bacterium]